MMQPQKRFIRFSGIDQTVNANIGDDTRWVEVENARLTEDGRIEIRNGIVEETWGDVLGVEPRASEFRAIDSGYSKETISLKSVFCWESYRFVIDTYHVYRKESDKLVSLGDVGNFTIQKKLAVGLQAEARMDDGQYGSSGRFAMPVGTDFATANGTVCFARRCFGRASGSGVGERLEFEVRTTAGEYLASAVVATVEAQAVATNFKPIMSFKVLPASFGYVLLWYQAGQNLQYAVIGANGWSAADGETCFYTQTVAGSSLGAATIALDYSSFPTWDACCDPDVVETGYMYVAESNNASGDVLIAVKIDTGATRVSNGTKTMVVGGTLPFLGYTGTVVQSRSISFWDGRIYGAAAFAGTTTGGYGSFSYEYAIYAESLVADTLAHTSTMNPPNKLLRFHTSASPMYAALMNWKGCGIGRVTISPSGDGAKWGVVTASFTGPKQYLNISSAEVSAQLQQISEVCSGMALVYTDDTAIPYATSVGYIPNSIITSNVCRRGSRLYFVHSLGHRGLREDQIAGFNESQFLTSYADYRPYEGLCLSELILASSEGEGEPVWQYLTSPVWASRTLTSSPMRSSREHWGHNRLVSTDDGLMFECPELFSLDVNASKWGYLDIGYLHFPVSNWILTLKENTTPRSARGPNAFCLSGGIPLTIDGAQAVEAGFLERPRISFESDKFKDGSSTAWPEGTYHFCAVFAWQDKNGNVFRSEPSNVMEITVSAGEEPDRINLPIYSMCASRHFAHYYIQPGAIGSPGIVERAENAGYSEPSIEIYAARDTVNPVLKLYAKIANTYLSGPSTWGVSASVASLTYRDFASLETRALYTLGGILPTMPVEASRDVCFHNDRWVWVDDFCPNVLKVSKQYVVGEGAGRAAEFDFPMPNELPVRRLISTPNYLLVVQDSSVFALSGQGPNDYGNQNDWSQMKLVTQGYDFSQGCMVATNGEVSMILGEGIVLVIDQNLQPTLASRALKVELSSYSTPVSCDFHLTRNEFWATFADTAEEKTKTLVYSVSTGAWSSFHYKNEDGVALEQSALAYAPEGMYQIAGGKLYAETSVLRDCNATTVVARVQTNWMAPWQTGSQGRVFKSALFAESVQMGAITAKTRINGIAAVAHSSAYTSLDIEGLGAGRPQFLWKQNVPIDAFSYSLEYIFYSEPDTGGEYGPRESWDIQPFNLFGVQVEEAGDEEQYRAKIAGGR